MRDNDFETLDILAMPFLMTITVFYKYINFCSCIDKQSIYMYYNKFFCLDK